MLMCYFTIQILIDECKHGNPCSGLDEVLHISEDVCRNTVGSYMCNSGMSSVHCSYFAGKSSGVLCTQTYIWIILGAFRYAYMLHARPIYSLSLLLDFWSKFTLS